MSTIRGQPQIIDLSPELNRLKGEVGELWREEAILKAAGGFELICAALEELSVQIARSTY